MKLTPARPGRTAVLILLLLVTCYFADWTDDYFSYTVASGYTSGTSSRAVGGGHMNSSVLLAAFTPTRSDEKKSALEAVFGTPLGARPTTSATVNADALSSAVASNNSDIASRAADAMNPRSGYGFGSSNSFGSRGLTFGNNSTFGASGGLGYTGTPMGLGLSGGSSFGGFRGGAMGGFSGLPN